MTHQVRDQVSLELAKRVARELSLHPERVETARSNLDRWSRLNHDSPALLICYAEWREILGRPLDDVIAVLVDPGERGQRLRQNSPFAGVLSPREVWEIKRGFRAATAS
jgi:hypothetical protein